MPDFSLPWTESPHTKSLVYDRNGERIVASICAVDGEPVHPRAFVIRAVNNHDALVAFVRDYVAARPPVLPEPEDEDLSDGYCRDCLVDVPVHETGCRYASALALLEAVDAS